MIYMRGIPEELRFWAKVDIRGDNECWPWLAKVVKEGYGQFRRAGRHGRQVTAHRQAWEYVNGAIPAGICALHRCDNPPCCNPSHIFLGTHADNMADKTSKGRNGSLSGDDSPNAVCSDDDVFRVRRQHKSGIPIRALVNRFGVSETTIRNYINGRNRKCLR